ncbi:protein-cysteine N-palmitoyltransferase HHAT isoform X2 [Rhipicephalus sanguineus]|uniref:protein-cysteine N-palmitoyltransferase HHAT isoform X2 n=1 Tax=Rhipicephalus sanguineus TaxID=34632 RepID=UPI0020C490E2|nr:protein-cysteine N-palmitoyltransferase HHAT isoform X2 [Rhipicephalus sanguineus]
MKERLKKSENTKSNRDDEKETTDAHSKWTWGPVKVYHWTVTFGAFSYIMWRFATNEENAFLTDQMKYAFVKSPYGLKQKQDASNWGWQTTRYVMVNTWNWYLLHPILARITAHVKPSLVPVFYATYSSLFVTSHLGWEVALMFLAQHAIFYAVAALHIPALCYLAAAVIHCQKFVNPFDPATYMYERYGIMPHRVAYVAFHWNIMRGLSFSLHFVRAQRQSAEKSRWLPYWKTLAYMIYLPTVYLGPPQNYDDYVVQLDKPRRSCTLREIATSVARILRSGAHFFLMELMAHFFYSSAMARWPWMAERLDLYSLVGFAFSLLFFFYVRYLFTYGFAGAIARAEGVEIPPPSMCIATMYRCSYFWRYFDRGMHLWIRRYIYEPVVGSSRRAHRLALGTAVAFTFTWVWHSMHGHDGIWCALSVLGIVLEVITIEIMKWTPVKKFQGRYLASAERIREAKALLGSPHYLLTICACIFHLAELDVCLVIVRRTLTGFPFPLVLILVALYSASHVSMDVADWEAAAMAKQKEAAS